ncbi:MAG: hypothetical protein P1Q69_20865, partial [Candidatus Thorarchaeota archaeon]|nr:hypothetical protein [Candidatus Thorarchaeota archaeon]
RLTTPICLAISQRTIIPHLWTTLCQSTELSISHVVSLFETIALSHNPKYLNHSEKLYLKFLPFSYQRMAYEESQILLGTTKMHDDIEIKTKDFLQGISDVKRLYFLRISPPLITAIRKLLADLQHEHMKIQLSFPIKTVFDYLLLAYLRDQFTRENELQPYLIPDDRVGMRNANRIFRGCKNIEIHLGIKDRILEKDLTPVPGFVLQHLMKMNLIEMGPGRMTSSKGSFRVKMINNLVLDYARSFLEEFEPHTQNDIILKLGE